MNQRQPIAGIWLSPALIKLKQTPAEKHLLAFICQRAALSDGYCTDSNRELAAGTAIHLQTVSDLINRLSQTPLLEARVDAAQANQRTLRPSDELVADYSHLAYSTQADYKPNDYSNFADYKSNDYSTGKQTNQPARPHRLCPVTGIDITHQRPNCKVVTTTTLKAFAKQDRARFDELSTKLLPPQWANEPMPSRCHHLSEVARKWLKTAPFPTGQPATQPNSAFQRSCPVTGVDITHQGSSYPVATAATLKRLFKTDYPQFDALMVRLGFSDQRTEPMGTQCLRLKIYVDRQALTHSAT